MEDYLRQFRLGPHTQDLAWLDCGSGADGLDREWDLGPDGAHGLSEQERDAVRFRVAQGIIGRPGSAPQGWRRWAEEAFHPPQPWRDLLGAAVRSAASGPRCRRGLHVRPAGTALGRGCPASCCRACGARPPRVCVVIDTSGVGQRRRTGQRAARGRRHLPCRGRPPRPGHRAVVRRGGRVVHPLCRAEGIAAGRRWGYGSAHGFRQGAARPATPRCARRADRRPDTLAGSPARVSDRGWAVPSGELVDRTRSRLRPGRATGLGAGRRHRDDSLMGVGHSCCPFTVW